MLTAEDGSVPLIEGDVVELPLLLPTCQALILETLAHQQGLTAAALVRHLLSDFLSDQREQGHFPQRRNASS